jgi:hypothetical protein
MFQPSNDRGLHSDVGAKIADVDTHRPKFFEHALLLSRQPLEGNLRHSPDGSFRAPH